MVSKSHGPQRRTREKFRKSRRTTISKFLQKFKIGDKVVIKLESASAKGRPFRRFHGISGEVVDTRGKAYVVKIKDGGKLKKIVSKPEHLRLL